MDVEGAFNHTSTQIIYEEAARKGVPRSVVDWMMDLLGSRKITTNGNVGIYRCSGTVSTGTPQGWWLHRLDWNLVDALVSEQSHMDG